MDGPYGRYGAAKLVLALRTAGIMDQRIAEAFEKTPREPFVAASFADAAWENIELPIDCGQTQTRPVTVAQMIVALDLHRDSTVLEIGTGSGYPAAVMARLSRRIVSLDRYRTIVARAERSLDQLGLSRVDVRLADGRFGWVEAAPFDRIIVMGAVEALPEALVDQLGVDGVLVAPIGTGAEQKVVKFERGRDRVLKQTELFAGRFTPLEEGVARML